MKFFLNTGVRIASSNLGTTTLQTLYDVEVEDVGEEKREEMTLFPTRVTKKQ